MQKNAKHKQPPLLPSEERERGGEREGLSLSLTATAIFNGDCRPTNYFAN